MDKPTYFLTAYGIAMKHGFQGTEEEWLISLTAFYLAQQAGYTGTVDEWLQLLIDPVPAIAVGSVTTLPGGSEATVSISGSRLAPRLNFGIPRGLGMADALPLIGGTMQGSIDMHAFTLYGLPDPVNDTAAVPKKYLDEAIKVSNKYTDDSVKVATGAAAGAQATADAAAAAAAKAGTAAADAMNAANEKAVRLSLTVSLTASGWTGASAPYVQTITKEEITAEDCPRYGVIYSQNPDTRLKEREAFGFIDDLETAAGTLTFTCFDCKPDTDLNIQLEVIR